MKWSGRLSAWENCGGEYLRGLHGGTSACLSVPASGEQALFGFENKKIKRLKEAEAIKKLYIPVEPKHQPYVCIHLLLKSRL